MLSTFWGPTSVQPETTFIQLPDGENFGFYSIHYNNTPLVSKMKNFVKYLYILFFNIILFYFFFFYLIILFNQ